MLYIKVLITKHDPKYDKSMLPFGVNKKSERKPTEILRKQHKRKAVFYRLCSYNKFN